MEKYPFQAEINGETWYVEAHGDTEDQAREEALWIFKRAARVPLTKIENLRLEALKEND